MFQEERRILAASRIDEYDHTRAELARNRACWVSASPSVGGKRSVSAGLSVQQLFNNLLVLLDG